MRVLKTMLASLGTLLAASATALAVPLAALQDAPVKVDIKTEPTHTVWYADPMWLGVGAVVVLVIIVLAVMASRRGGDTTVVR